MDCEDDDNRVFVGGLMRGTTPEELAQAFLPFGAVTETEIAVDRETGCPRGFGFVTFTNVKSVLNAIRWMHDSELFGRTVSVKPAYPRTKHYYYNPHYTNNYDTEDYDTDFPPFGNKSCSHDQNYDYNPHNTNNSNNTQDFEYGFCPQGDIDHSDYKIYNCKPYNCSNPKHASEFPGLIPCSKRTHSHCNSNPRNDNSFNETRNHGTGLPPNGNINKASCNCNKNKVSNNNDNSQAEQGNLNQQKGKNVDDSSVKIKKEETEHILCFLCRGTGNLTEDCVNDFLSADITADSESESEPELEFGSEESSDGFEYDEYGRFYDEYGCEYEDFTHYCEICEEWGHFVTYCDDFEESDRFYFCECKVECMKIAGHCLACGGLPKRTMKLRKRSKQGLGGSSQNPTGKKKDSAKNDEKSGGAKGKNNGGAGMKSTGESSEKSNGGASKKATEGTGKQTTGESSEKPNGGASKKATGGAGKKSTGGIKQEEEPGNFMGLKLGFLKL